MYARVLRFEIPNWSGFVQYNIQRVAAEGIWLTVLSAGAGHWLPPEQPERVAGLAIDWFRRHAPGR
jgi:hypothetical protein